MAELIVSAEELDCAVEDIELEMEADEIHREIIEVCGGLSIEPMRDWVGTLNTCPPEALLNQTRKVMYGFAGHAR